MQLDSGSASATTSKFRTTKGIRETEQGLTVTRVNLYLQLLTLFYIQATKD